MHGGGIIISGLAYLETISALLATPEKHFPLPSVPSLGVESMTVKDLKALKLLKAISESSTLILPLPGGESRLPLLTGHYQNRAGVKRRLRITSIIPLIWHCLPEGNTARRGTISASSYENMRTTNVPVGTENIAECLRVFEEWCEKTNMIAGILITVSV